MPTYKGALDHDLLDRAYQSGYTPEVRVWLQEIGEDGRAGPMMRRLDHWTNVGVHREVGNGGSATIALSNVGDRFFCRQYAREPDLGQHGHDYFAAVLPSTMPYVRAINPARFGRNTAPRGTAPGLTDGFQGIKSFVTADDVRQYVQFLYDFSGITTKGASNEQVRHMSAPRVGPDGPAPAPPASARRDLVDLGLMQRVTIDAKGPDGEWYAMFTGVVTAIEDGFKAKEAPAVILHCRDYWRLLQLSEVVLRSGVESGALQTSLELMLQLGDAQAPKVLPSTYLAGMTAPQVLLCVLDLINRSYAWLPFAMWKLDLGRYGYDHDPAKTTSKVIEGPVQREHFFHDEGFWYIPFFDNAQKGMEAPYVGATPLRRFVKKIHQYDKDGIGGKAPRVVTPAAITDTTDSFPVAALDSTLLVDANITSGPQADAYRVMIEGLLDLFQIDKSTSDQVVKKVADATFYDVFFDGNGSLVYQIPKYNNLPGDFTVDFVEKRMVGAYVSNASGLVESSDSNVGGAALSVPKTDTVVYGRDMRPTGSFTHFDFAPDGEGARNFAWRFHGTNYILTDLGLRSWQIASNDDMIVTDVEVPAQPHYINQDQVVTSGFFTGRTNFQDFPEVQALQGRFGHRYTKAQPMLIPARMYAAGNIQPMMDAFAYALLIQLNGRAVSGAVSLSFRPDLDVGQTVLLLERQHLFMVMSIDWAVRYGQDATTNLKLSFGHDVGKQIPNPWLIVRDRIQQAESEQQAQQSLPPEGGSSAAITEGAAYSGAPMSYAETQSRMSSWTPYQQGQQLPGLSTLEARLSSLSRGSTKLTKGTDVPYPGGVKGIMYVKEDIQLLYSVAVQKAASLGVTINSIDEYTLARVIASETGGAKLFIQVMIAWMTVYESRGNITRRCTAYAPKDTTKIAIGKYAQQGAGSRYMATGSDPTLKHLVVAQAVMAGTVQAPIPPNCQYLSPRTRYQKHLSWAEKKRKGDPNAGKDKFSSPTLKIALRWAGGDRNKPKLCWLNVPGVDSGAQMVLAPSEFHPTTGGQNIYGVESWETTEKEILKHDKRTI